MTQPASVMERRNAEHWVSLLYGRAVSLRITSVLIRTPVSADALTVAMIGIGLGGAATLLIPAWWGALLCAVLIQLYLIFDCVDGEVARWRRTTSPRGEYLDRLGHYVVEAALLAAFGWRVGGGPTSGWTTIGLLTALLAVITKAETDLVAATMGRKGTELATAQISVPRRTGVRRLRALTHPLKIHRMTGAVEASLLILVAALAVAAGWDAAEQVLALAFLIVSALLVVGHAVSILTSSRLRPGP